MRISDYPFGYEYLNFHDGSSTGVALQTIFETYNRIIKIGLKTGIDVNHGYGSTGKGGEIRIRLRTYLQENKEYLDYQIGEEVDDNISHTVIYPRKSLPPIRDYLQPKILDFLSEYDKSLEKILGEFRLWRQVDIKKAIETLEKKGLIQLRRKGNIKIYHKL